MLLAASAQERQSQSGHIVSCIKHPYFRCFRGVAAYCTTVARACRLVGLVGEKTSALDALTIAPDNNCHVFSIRRFDKSVNEF